MASIEEKRFDSRLAKIVAAAAEVFAEQGYDRAAIRRVAERAGLSVPGIYHYVGSKQELLFLIQHRVFSELIERYAEVSGGERDPAVRLEILIRNHLERFLANLPELIVCSREIDRLERTFHNGVQAKRREYFGLALRLFAELAERHGALSVDPRTAALAMFGSVNWVHTWYRPRAGISAASLARDFARIYLHGVLPGEAQAQPPAPVMDPAGRNRPSPPRSSAE